MVDYLPPEGVTLEQAADALLGTLEARDGKVRETDRTFYDTFDGLLHAAGLVLVHEDGRLVLVEPGSDRERAGVLAARPACPLLAQDLEPGPLRDALVPIIDVRALLPLVRVHAGVRALDVLDAAQKTVVRIALEAPALVSSAGRRSPLHPRVRLAAVRGYGEQLERVRETLERELGYFAAAEPIVDEAVIAAGGRPGGTSSKIDVPLARQERSDAAASAILRALLAVMEANLEGTIADFDSEFLHDFRVATRRTRSVQRELRGVFPAAELARFRAEFRWLQQVTGDARDLDVYVLEFDDFQTLVPVEMRADLEPLLGVLRARRAGARREMVHALRSERATALRSDWSAFLDRLVALPEPDRPDAARPIAELSGQRIRKVYRRMVRMGAAIDRASPSEDYHELRKKGKELRYLLELFGSPLYPNEVVKPMIKALKALQDVLGRHQDREIQVGMLRALSAEVAPLAGGPAALMAMGVLVQRLSADQRAARGEFAERFAAFASRSQQRLVKDTFR